MHPPAFAQLTPLRPLAEGRLTLVVAFSTLGLDHTPLTMKGDGSQNARLVGGSCATKRPDSRTPERRARVAGGNRRKTLGAPVGRRW